MSSTEGSHARLSRFLQRSRITPAAISAAREALARPTQLAEGLPGVFYGADFYAIERRTLFTRTWCAVTVGAAIPNVGDLLPIELAGWPILLFIWNGVALLFLGPYPFNAGTSHADSGAMVDPASRLLGDE